MKRIMVANLMVLLSCLSSARAEIPSEFSKMGMKTPQKIVGQNSNGVVYVNDAVHLHSMYSDAQLIELVIENLAFEKEIYIYDRSPSNEFERNIKVRFVRPSPALSWLNHGEALYLGKTSDGRDRFLIALVSAFRSKQQIPIEVYVKMGGMQFETRDLKIVTE